jgi:hypothetical protein
VKQKMGLKPREVGKKHGPRRSPAEKRAGRGPRRKKKNGKDDC